MDSRLLSHSTASTSGARNALAGHSHVCAIAKPSRSRRNGRCVQLHVSARVSAPERLQTNGVREVSERTNVQSEMSSPKPDFTWSKNWYPVAVASLLEEDKPNKVTLLGRDYVVWYGDGMWNAAKDECPHRFAALSVGRVEDGQLFCRYHGWGFKGGEEGRCSCNPQAVGPEAETTVLNSSRSRLQTYPSQVQQGLLWIWPESGADAWLEASAKPPVTTPEMANTAFAGAQADFAFMENPASLQVMLENALDPSHASYVHNLVISKRQDAAPMQMALSGEIDAQQGFILEHGGYSKSQQEGNMKAKRYFIPPCTIRTHYTYESGREDITTLYLVPVAPGVTRAYNKVVLKNVASRTKSIFNFLSRTVLSSGFFHAFGHGLVDQDMNVLHEQERKLAGKPRGWRDYYLATQSDTGVASFWRWLGTFAGGDVEWSDGVSPELPPQRSIEDLRNHYDRHTKYCSACQKAIRRLDQISNGIVALSAVLGTAAAFAIPEAAEFSALGLPVQWRLMTGLIALAVLSLRGPVLSFRQRFFHADAIIG
ncbi:hypothetical protein CVIRNUC_007987 [Coccomyxa viridis]|uniref:Rieske domain-containing protein n=1 Tax=Coccomyxa viridis TaxID=1274662 RepID=A0AAV1IFV1_9CHLO|nr:hypothetical protein CVIRNUC_007987 [Coccomyxa viridis]